MGGIRWEGLVLWAGCGCDLMEGIRWEGLVPWASCEQSFGGGV